MSDSHNTLSNINSKIRINLYRGMELVIGSDLAKELYMRICVNRYRSAGVVFVHVPRAGGTSIANSVLGRRAGHFKAEEIRSIMGDKEFREMFSFAVVRNPFDRLVSAYHYASQGGGVDGGILRKRDYKSHKFSSFETFVKEWLVYQDMANVDVIFKPQYDFVASEDGVIVDYVGRLEELTDAECVVSSKLGRRVIFGHRNSSKRMLGYRRYYDFEMIKLVERVYQKDISYFGYKF